MAQSEYDAHATPRAIQKVCKHTDTRRQRIQLENFLREDVVSMQLARAYATAATTRRAAHRMMYSNCKENKANNPLLLLLRARGGDSYVL